MTFDEVMASEVRPVCEPRITVSGTDENGESITIVWNAKDIASLTFKRSIDPVGRNLPTLELQWDEIYYGKFNKQNFPEKYQNVPRYMSVRLEFIQDLEFYRTWKGVKTKTWLKLKQFTWKTLKNNVDKKIVSMPMMFLEAAPEISGNTIKWTAKDALSFLTESQIKGFYATYPYGNKIYEIPFYNPIVYLLINARAAFYHSKELFDYYTRTISYFYIESSKGKKLNHPVVFNGATNSEIMKYLCPKNEYLDFDDDKIIKRSFSLAEMNTNSTIEVPLKLQYGTPTSEMCAAISRYDYNQYTLTLFSGQNYTMTPTTVTDLGESSSVRYLLEYVFNGYGTTILEDEEINRALQISNNADDEITVEPIQYQGQKKQIIIANKGNIYEEDNTLNVYTPDELKSRGEVLQKWYNAENHIIKNQTPAMFNWGIGKLANCETLMYNNDGTHYVVPAMLIEYTMEYNGALKQTNIAHGLEG